jgi:hypothetical protein
MLLLCVNLDGLEQKINRELLIVNALKDQLISLEGSQTFDKFDLAKQTQVLKIIASAFNLEASAFKSNKKGDVYVIRGNTKNIVLLAYKLNKIISNKGLRAQVRALIITGNVGVLEVHVFGVDND